MGSEKYPLAWFIITLIQDFVYYLNLPLQPIFNWLCRRQGIYRRFAARKSGSDDFADPKLIPLIEEAIKDSTEILFALGELGHRFIDNQRILESIENAYERNGVVTMIIHGPRIDPETTKIFDLARKGAVKLYTLSEYPTGHFGIFNRRSGYVSLYDEEPHSEVLWERTRGGKPFKLHSSRYRARYFRWRSLGLANARKAEFRRRLKQASPTSLDPNKKLGYEHPYRHPFLRTLISGARNFFYWVAIEPLEVLSDKKLTIPVPFASISSTVLSRETEKKSIEVEKARSQVKSVLHQVIQAPENDVLLDRFREAYEYRRQFPYLGESGQVPGKNNRDGVAYALRQALSTYIPEEPDQFEKENDAKKPAIDQDKERNRWRTKVSQSVDSALSDPIRLQQFANTIDSPEVRRSSKKPRQLKEHITNALEQYYERHKLNTSSDPW